MLSHCECAMPHQLLNNRLWRSHRCLEGNKCMAKRMEPHLRNGTLVSQLNSALYQIRGRAKKHSWVIVVLTRLSQLGPERAENNYLKQSITYMLNNNSIKGNGAGGGTRTLMTEVAGF